MKYCISCGAVLESTDAFCANCGDRVEPDMASGPLSGSASFAPREEPSDIACTEVWNVVNSQPIAVPLPVPAPAPASDPNFFDSESESPTVIAQQVDEDDFFPTIVVAQERFVLTRQKNGERLELVLPCIVGRGSASDCRVRGNPAISRKHAKVYSENGLVTVKDLASTNSTYVNGEVLPAKGSAPLSDGSVLRLGDEDFSFSIEWV